MLHFSISNHIYCCLAGNVIFKGLFIWQVTVLLNANIPVQTCHIISAFKGFLEGITNFSL